MSVHMETVRTAVPSEQAWYDWLLGLEPWERHFAFPHEQDWYDDYLAGLIELSQLSKIVQTHFKELEMARDPHSRKVDE